MSGSAVHVLTFVLYISSIRMKSDEYNSMYVWLSHISNGMDQPGKVANPARGQLNREN